MSLYNMIHGVNEKAPLLFSLAGLVQNANEIFPRFRDVYGHAEGTEIAIYTRVGGGNRESYAEVIELIRKIPTYLRDEDDSFDSTFATFYFRPVHELASTMLRKLYQMGHDGSERPVRARQMLEDMQAGRETDLTRHAMKKMQPIAEGLRSAMEGDAKSVTVEDINGHAIVIEKIGGQGGEDEVRGDD